jgi:integrase
LAAAQCAAVLAIPTKKAPVTEIRDLDENEISAILAQPDRSKLEGQRDHVLLAVLYNTGAEEGWLFANPATDRPYHQEEIQKKHIRVAAKAAGITFPVGWKTFRHSYRSWLDETDAPIGVQRELMRHASIQTTMNVYGRAMTDSKRQAHHNVVQMILQASGKEGLDKKQQDEIANVV